MVRACTPWVVLKRDGDGSVSVGGLKSHDQIWREIKLEQYLASHGPDEDIDLQRLHDATTMFGSILGGIRCHRSKNAWLASYIHSGHEDEWSNRARKLVVARRYDAIWYRLDKLAAALEPRFRFGQSAWNRILHIPIDMSRPIEEQLERARPRLTQARDYLYRYTRKGPPRDRTRTVWRDVYAFLLAEISGRSVSEIGQEVFPAEDKRSREAKVRMILGRVRSLARRIDFPSAHAKLSPPAKSTTPP
jgi:hypothetical protein